MQLWSRLTGFSAETDRRFPPIGEVMQLPHGAVHLLQMGPPGDIPMVLLHGASGNLRDHAMSLMPLLAEERHVIAFDRPGFGHSDSLPGAWKLRVQINTLRSVLHRLGHDRYHLIGHSYSGALALAWALVHPREVIGLGLISGAAMDWGGELELSYRIGGAPVIGPLISRIVPLAVSDRMVARALVKIFEPAPVPEEYRRGAGVEMALRPTTFQVNFRAMNKLYDQIRLNAPQYGRITCPAEIIHGLADDIVPAAIHAEPLAAVLPEARLTLIDGAGHMPHHSHSDRVASALFRLPLS